MEDEEDLIKITRFLEEHKEDIQNNSHLQFEEFILANSEDEESEDEITTDSNVRVSECIDVKTKYIFPNHVVETTLKSEERSLIESCEDGDLSNLLLLNRAKNMQLIQLYKKIKDLLLECQETIKCKETLLQTGGDNVNHTCCAYKLAAPYFKTKSLYLSPPNEDTINRRKINELSIYEIRPTGKWSRMECDNLIRSVKVNYNINRQMSINKQLTTLHVKKNKVQFQDQLNEITAEINALENNLEYIKSVGDNDVPPLNSNDHVDWLRVAETFLKDKHTPEECESFWHLYLNPHINKNSWSNEENEQIQELASVYQYQDWDTIALTLGTNRSGFAVCLHYFSNLCAKFKRNKFTNEEDELLLETVEKVRIGSYIPWNIVEQYFSNRSRNQLLHRYKYFNRHLNIIRGKFTEAEDIMIMILVDRFGRNYSQFVKYIPHRSCMQIKSRYSSNLNIDIKKGSFTVDEDRIILKYGDSESFKHWGCLTSMLKRSRGQLRQRFRIIKSFLRDNPDKTVENVTKRIHRSYNKEKNHYQFLRCMADQCKELQYIPTLEVIENMLGIKKSKRRVANSGGEKITAKKNVGLKDIDSMLVDFFSTSCNINHKQNEIMPRKIIEGAENIFDILQDFSVELDLPEDIEENEYLDHIDVEILRHIQQKQKVITTDLSSSHIHRYIPPNTNTLTGLRSILIKNKLHKRKIKNKESLLDMVKPTRNTNDTDIIWQIEKSLVRLDEVTKKIVIDERNKFCERFSSLFWWPSLLSLEPPNPNLLTSELGIENQNCDLNNDKDEKTNVKNSNNQPISSNKRPTTKSVDLPAKKIKLSGPKIDQLSAASKMNLKPVDKSVITKMVLNGKRPTMFLVKNTKSVDGTVNTVMEPISDINKFLGNTHTVNSNFGVDSQSAKPAICTIDLTTDLTLIENPSTKCISDARIIHKRSHTKNKVDGGSIIPKNLQAQVQARFKNVLKRSAVNKLPEKVQLKVCKMRNNVSQPSIITKNEDHSESSTRNEGLKDIEKLNSVLNGASLDKTHLTKDCSENELLKNDVELLRELIKYERNM